MFRLPRCGFLKCRPACGTRYTTHHSLLSPPPLIYLKSIRSNIPDARERFPFCLPFVESIREVEISSEILFFVGENGSGKSTLLESLALASKRINIGASDFDKEQSLQEIKSLADQLTLGWSRRTSKGFFLRAEDFFGFIRRNKELESEFDEYIERFKDDARVRGYMQSNKNAINSRYGRDLNDFSHGEGFLNFFKSRIVPGGLYLIDEPEAALSPQRQLAFIFFVHEMAQQGCQFIIATHSPIVLSAPNSQIWKFAEDGISTANYHDLDHVRFTKSFLDSPQRYWRHLIEEE